MSLTLNTSAPIAKSSDLGDVRFVAGQRYCFLSALVAFVAVVAVWLGAAFASPAAAAPSQTSACPALMVYAVQGTGQSSPDADPSQDAGFLSQVLQPVMKAMSGAVDRAYVPYDAGFGGAVAGGSETYQQSVTGAVSKLESWLNAKAKACPNTRFGLVGYSQGAHAVRVVMNDVVAGKTAIDDDRLALVANFGDPGRPKGASLFPGKPGQQSPSPVPGTSGANVAQVVSSSTAPSDGGGIAPEADVDNPSYEKIAGRYMSQCTSGDLACDAPADAPLAHLVANIAGQSEFNKDDPVASLSTIAQAVAMTAVKTAVPVINEDVQAPDNNLESLSFEPRQTLSERLATASDPRTPLPNAQDTLSAIMKVGTIGFNALKTVVQTVATPSTIGAIAVAGATNPLAIVGILGAKLGEAAVTLVPPQTQERLVSNAFDAFKSEFAANKDLFEITSLLKYVDAAKQHTSYGQVAATPTGQPPTRLVADWIMAAAKDLSGQAGGTSTSGSPDTTLPVPTSGDDMSWLFGGSNDSTSPSSSSSPSTSSTDAATSTPATPDFAGADPTSTDPSGSTSSSAPTP